jgi:hypothetical protein
MEQHEEEEELGFLGLSTAATGLFIDVRSGGLHRERRIAGGGSVDPQFSTELLVNSRKTMTYPPETVCRAGLRDWVLGRAS